MGVAIEQSGFSVYESPLRTLDVRACIRVHAGTGDSLNAPIDQPKQRRGESRRGNIIVENATCTRQRDG